VIEKRSEQRQCKEEVIEKEERLHIRKPFSMISGAAMAKRRSFSTSC
jgi:hypothetical protein